MKTPNSPSHDQTMILLGGIMETYAWTAFKPILYSPERLQCWIREKLKPDSDQEMHPDDQRVAELSELAMDSEDAALEFWGELSTKEQGMMKDAFQEIWGRQGRASLPL